MQPDDELNELGNPYATPLSPSDGSKAVASEEVLAQELKPFKTIWTRPRDTVRRIIAVNPELHVVLLVCLAGIGETLDRASMRNAGDAMPMAAIIGIACVFGPLGGLLSQGRGRVRWPQEAQKGTKGKLCLRRLLVRFVPFVAGMINLGSVHD